MRHRSSEVFQARLSVFDSLSVEWNLFWDHGAVEIALHFNELLELADIAVGMNAFASFIAYVSVAFVQKILTSLNSTLPQRGQAVSVHILTGIYRSQSAFHRRYRPSRRNYRPRP
ncbi:hypothetical protein DBV15_07796 [Temnothorax longispinosus]|uniref:Uncharacterized protein n=1 Tax=Temnothorax longispinosus TaxID=300112 RepID=A0A4S2KPE3_9HYME|nr:hypothetical protein DBV15_07796 [Temnothorax longispinosus]